MSPHNLLWGAVAVAAYALTQALYDRRKRRLSVGSVSKTSADQEMAEVVRPRLFSGKRLAFMAAFMVVGTLGSLIFDDLTRAGTSPSTTASPLPGVPDAEPLVASYVEQMQVTFGPFETIAVSPGVPTSDLRFPAVLMMYQDGRTEASLQWKLSFRAQEWVLAKMAPVRGATLKGDEVVFQTDDRVFAAKATQAFILETRPTEVYAFDALGNLRVLDMMRAAALRQSF